MAREYMKVLKDALRDDPKLIERSVFTNICSRDNEDIEDPPQNSQAEGLANNSLPQEKLLALSFNPQPRYLLGIRTELLVVAFFLMLQVIIVASFDIYKMLPCWLICSLTVGLTVILAIILAIGAYKSCK